MELFVIQCTTCHARLKVQNESIIGEIMSCPKCSSFVQVVPPPDWKPAQQPTQKAAAAAAAVAAPPPIPKAKAASDVRNAHKTPSSGTHPTIAAAAISMPKAPPAAVPAASAPPVAAAPAAKSVVPPPVQPQVVVPPPVSAIAGALPADAVAGLGVAVEVSRWQSLALRVQRDKWLFGGAFAAGTSIGLVMWLVMSSRFDAVAEAPQEPAAVTAPNEATPSESDPTASVPEQPAAQSPEPTPVATPAEPKPAEPVAATPAVEPAPQPVEPKPAAPANPPVADDGLANLIPGAATIDPAKKPVEAPPVPAESKPATPAATEPTPVQPAATNMPTTVLTDAQIDTRLGERMLSLEFTNEPLGRYVEFLAQFSTLPIIIDRDGLASVGKGAASPVTVNLKQTTVADALKAALAPHGLVFVVHNGHLIITIPRPQ